MNYIGETALGATLGPGPKEPKISIGVTKVDNGYHVVLVGQRKPDPVEPLTQLSEDERIDRMVDGLSAFLKYVNGKGVEGDEWKDDSDLKEKMREGFKTLYPGAAAPRAYTLPRQEQRVFETKEKLIEYLTQNL